MTEKTTDSGKSSTSTDTSTSMWTKTMAGWLHTQENVFAAVAEIAQENVAFTQTQMDAGIRACRKIAGCKEPKEAFAWQNEQFQQMVAAYFVHLKKIGDRIAILSKVSTVNSANGADSVGESNKQS